MVQKWLIDPIGNNRSFLLNKPESITGKYRCFIESGEECEKIF